VDPITALLALVLILQAFTFTTVFIFGVGSQPSTEWTDAQFEVLKLLRLELGQARQQNIVMESLLEQLRETIIPAAQGSRERLE
jgi:parvulin-like peptidyl-prolyl isomerase